MLHWLPAILLMAAFAWASRQPRWPEILTGAPDWPLHGVAYAVLAVACHWGASDGWRRRGPRAIMIGVVVAVLYGAFDEWHQSFVPGRHASVGDWIANTFGATTAGLILACSPLGGRSSHADKGGAEHEL